MKRTAKHQPIFAPTAAGTLVQIGNTSSFSVQDSAAYLAIKNRAVELRSLFASNGLSLDKSPTLGRLINDVVELSDCWLCNDWELELLRTLAENGISAAIGEPDLVITLSGPRIGVACKKLYSESNVSKVLSQAVAQIEKGFDFGMVALNIDDLLPENSILKASTIEQMVSVLAERNDDFLRAHERHLRRYLKPGRAMSALVSCAAIADVESYKTRFLNARQSTMWHIPGLPSEKEREMASFYAAFRSSYPK